MDEFNNFRYLSNYDLPVALSNGRAIAVGNRLFYIGGKTGTSTPGKNSKLKRPHKVRIAT
jgi:hypothetical protein